jgi:hypothetical protein
MKTYYSRLENIGKIIFIVLLIYLAFVSITAPNHWIFLDGANLIIHEAGHPLFMAFGRFAGFLGGTIFQLLVPAIISIYFLFRQQLFSAGFGFFWLGENLVNVSVYMKDATDMALPLVGWGSIHDWNWMFTELGILQHDQMIGGYTYVLGLSVMISSIGFMCWITSSQSLKP